MARRIDRRGEHVAGAPTPSAETTEVARVPVDRIAELPMDRSQRMRLAWPLAEHRTWIDPTDA